MPSGVKPRVLCIDRDSVSLRLRLAIVETGGFAAIGRASIQAAQQVLREQVIDIIVLDENAVENDNAALTQATKLFPAAPILFLSSLAPYQCNQESGFIRRFQKQDGPAAFITALREYVAGGGGRSHTQDGYQAPA